MQDHLLFLVIVKATNGPRYVVGCRRSLDKAKLIQGTRVALDMTTLTIMRQLPREVDPLVYNMSHEDPGNISYAQIGGLNEQIRQLREVSEILALTLLLRYLLPHLGSRIAVDQSGVVSPCWYYAAQRMLAVRSSRNWKDVARSRRC